jgi:hypothetical protein
MTKAATFRIPDLTEQAIRALRSYLGKDGRYHAPKETTFQRVLSNLDPPLDSRPRIPPSQLKSPTTAQRASSVPWSKKPYDAPD